MTERKPALNFVYGYLQDANKNHQWRYVPLIAFTDEGPISEQVILDTYVEHWQEPMEKLSFEDLADLKKYAYLLSQRLDKWGCYLVSSEQYNESLTETYDLAGFQSIFPKAGEVILNDEFNKSSGILGKIFN